MNKENNTEKKFLSKDEIKKELKKLKELEQEKIKRMHEAIWCKLDLEGGLN